MPLPAAHARYPSAHKRVHAAPPGSISALTQMSPEQQARFVSEAPPPPERTPAEADAMRFELDETVAGWANYATRFRDLAAGNG
eukprot:366311-Chlamydomonas_euryale.AAC.22